MTQASKFIRWLLRGFAALVIIAIGAFIVWRVNLAHDVDTKLQAIRAAGLPTNGKELNNYYPAVPDNENAALVMTQAFALMRNYPDSRSNEVASFEMPPHGQALTAKQKQLLSDYVEMNAAALAKVNEASKLTESRYPVDFISGVKTEFPHLAPLKKLARIAAFKGLLALNVGHLNDADISIANILGIARLNEPDLISCLVRFSIIRRATTALEHRLNAGGLKDAELIELGSAFTNSKKTNLLTRAEIGERAIGIPYFRKIGAESLGTTNEQPMFLKLSGFFERDLRFYLNAMETNIAIVCLPPPCNLGMGRNCDAEIAYELKHHHYIFSAMFLPSISNAIMHEDECVAGLSSATTALAVERFRLANGQLPENLNELVPQFLSAVPSDPFDGQPLRYHRLAKGYVIYSIGRDGRDAGGREKPVGWRPGDTTTYDITFTVER